MQITQQAKTLIDYLNNPELADKALTSAAKQQKANVAEDLKSASSNIQQGKFDELIKQMEKGQINVDLKTMENYVDFNNRKIERELGKLAADYQVKTPLKLSFSDGKITVDDDSPQGKRLQNYLDKEGKLNKLMEQTSKLSQFHEWGKIKEQAGEYKKAKVKEDDIVEFLKNSRANIMSEDHYQLNGGKLKLDSHDRSVDLIKTYNKTFDYKKPA